MTLHEEIGAHPYDGLDDVLRDRRILLDCRWLGFGGAGRVTELLLGDLRETTPAGTWTLWGRPDRVSARAFPGAGCAPWSGDPRAWFGQRDWLRHPACDIAIYLHQIRPLRPGKSVTVIHDTIPLRFGGRAAVRLAKRIYFLAVARVSTQVLTDSDFAATAVARDLRVPSDRISVMRFPVDHDRAARIARLRNELRQEPRLLYLGRFASHKNVERLCIAFARSTFAGRGGTLELVGGSPDEIDRLGDWLRGAGIDGVAPIGECSEEELDRLLATSRALIAPSLEEGYGLPAFEAASSGLPVAVSPTGAMGELSSRGAIVFQPRDLEAMTAAIDDVTEIPAQEPWPPVRSTLGRTVVAALARALSSS